MDEEMMCLHDWFNFQLGYSRLKKREEDKVGCTLLVLAEYIMNMEGRKLERKKEYYDLIMVVCIKKMLVLWWAKFTWIKMKCESMEVLKKIQL